MSPRKPGTPRPSRAKPRAESSTAVLEQPDELVTVTPAMNGAPLGFEGVSAPPASSPDPEAAAAAALAGDPTEQPGAGDVAGDVAELSAPAPAWTGEQLIDAAEAATSAVVLMSAERHKVPAAEAAELDRLSMLSRMERTLLGLVADDAAAVLGTRGHVPPKLAAGLFFAGVLWIGFARLRSVAALAPAKRAAAAQAHRDRWGSAANAVPEGTAAAQGGFPPQFEPEG